MYQQLLNEFSRNPRDVHTVPLQNRKPLWYYVFVRNDRLYIEPAHIQTPKSSVKRRQLQEKECSHILNLYHRRLRGEQVSSDAQACTYSQVYWFGIFSALNL